jgi:hypothetical protein
VIIKAPVTVGHGRLQVRDTIYLSKDNRNRYLTHEFESELFRNYPTGQIGLRVVDARVF